MSEIYIIDRFEGDIAVLERQSDGEMIDIAKSKLPENAKVGAVIKYDGEKYGVDENETQRLRDEVRKMQDDLFE